MVQGKAERGRKYRDEGKGEDRVRGKETEGGERVR